MNIFYLHEDPQVSAKMHCDKHVVKMIIEGHGGTIRRNIKGRRASIAFADRGRFMCQKI